MEKTEKQASRLRVDMIQKLKKKNTKFSRWIMQYFLQWDLFLLFIPIIAWYIVFEYVPSYGVVIAFQDYKLTKGILGSEWVGLKYFYKLFSTPTFWVVFKNSFEISLLKIIFGFPAPIILALLFNEITKTKFKKVIQTISYLPHFLSWVIMAGIFMQILSPSTGFVNQLLNMFGIESIYFMGDARWFRFTLIVTDIWASVGWGSIIYIASITSIDTQLYEAAIVDGANRLQLCTKITLPCLAPILTIQLIMTTGGIINAGFDQIFNMYNEAVYKVADIIDTYVYRKGLKNMEFSYAAAVGLFKNVISVVMITGSNMIAKRINEYGIW